VSVYKVFWTLEKPLSTSNGLHSLAAGPDPKSLALELP